MLQNDLYIVETNSTEGNIFKFQIALNREHPVFKGHFPGQPVLPGACMLQMVKELVKDALGKTLTLKKADNLKFLAFVDPDKNERITAELNVLENDGQIKVTANFNMPGITFFRFSGTFSS